MNSSIRYIQADYVLSLNAGDFFVSNNIISSAFDENGRQFGT